MEKIIVNGYYLDKDQLTPILDKKKYSLIIAGAGSGKTLTLIGKIKYVLEKNLFLPEEICCISFTNESVKDLRQNIWKNCQQEIPTFTFHKLALQILKQAKEDYLIAEESMLQNIIDEFFQSMCYENKKLQNIIYQKFSSFFKGKKTWQTILNTKEFQTYKKTIITFINLMKANGYEKKDFQNFFKKKKWQKTLILIYAIYTFYETEKWKTKTIDFDDMLLLATKKIKEEIVKLPFKLIIIDEFQDTSLSRFSLIQEIIKKNHASLCVVGDDYQSIYHFSGCDLEIFLQFQKYFPTAQIYKLEKTYRNSIELNEIAGKFIMKNPNQIKKEIRSEKNENFPILFCYYKNEDSILEKIIKEIDEKKEIMILSRNHFDLKSYTKNLKYKVLENNYIQFEKMKQYKIRFLTIHKAKGLESDIVILLNVKNDTYGIPNKKNEEEILSLVKKTEQYKYEEERRLLYVALTRTKEKVYLLIPQKNPSIFVEELKYQKHIKRKKY